MGSLQDNDQGSQVVAATIFKELVILALRKEEAPQNLIEGVELDMDIFIREPLQRRKCNFDADSFMTFEEPNLYEALNHLFSWQGTTMGGNFWNAVYDILRKHNEHKRIANPPKHI